MLSRTPISGLLTGTVDKLKTHGFQPSKDVGQYVIDFSVDVSGIDSDVNEVDVWSSEAPPHDSDDCEVDLTAP